MDGNDYTNTEDNSHMAFLIAFLYWWELSLVVGKKDSLTWSTEYNPLED